MEDVAMTSTTTSLKSAHDQQMQHGDARGDELMNASDELEGRKS
jgi:hypothetical protein